MDVAVVYESIYGNTRTIAEAVAEGVRDAEPGAHVAVLTVGEATRDRIEGAALVVVGGPTHMRGMSRPSSRRKAPAPVPGQTRGDERVAPPTTGTDGPGIREWLHALPRPEGTRMAAAFDTRLPFALAGGAARPIARGLRRHGYRVVARPKGFLVDGGQGPLRTGERERARRWGAGLARQAARGPAH